LTLAAWARRLISAPPILGTAPWTNNEKKESKGMIDELIFLDAWRSVESMIEIDFRRQSLEKSQADQKEHRRKKQELETRLLAGPASNWHQAAIKAKYLICRYAESAFAQDDSQQILIRRALGDIDRLIEAEAANQ